MSRTRNPRAVAAEMLAEAYEMRRFGVELSGVWYLELARDNIRPHLWPKGLDAPSSWIFPGGRCPGAGSAERI